MFSMWVAAMIQLPDIIWLAGYLEGEGCFQSRPSIQVATTDPDVARKVRNILNGTLHGPYDRGKKPVWYIALPGPRSIGWMMTIYTFLGQRRQEKIRGILSEWKSRPQTWRAFVRIWPRAENAICKFGHPVVFLPHISRGRRYISRYCQICSREKERRRYLRGKLAACGWRQE
mgnify:CR=1 FL=1